MDCINSLTYIAFNKAKKLHPDTLNNAIYIALTSVIFYLYNYTFQW